MAPGSSSLGIRLITTFKGILRPGTSLGQRAARGAVWVLALRITTRVLSFGRIIILARVLAPEDFGLMGIAMLGMSALETFSQTGFDAALVQRREDVKAYLDTAWTLGLLRGALLSALLFLGAPYIALFFNSPPACPITRVVGISTLLAGLTNIGVVYFRRELDFRKEFAYQLGGVLADFAVATTAAVVLQSAWALVLGLLVGNTVRCVMSYLIHPFRPHPRFQASRARELYTFGRWILATNVMLLFLTRGGDAVVGKLFGATSLGLYGMAYTIGTLPAAEIAHAVWQVMFSAYSRLQDSSAKLQSAWLATTQLIGLVSAPLATTLLILGPDMTRLLLGEKWVAISSPMRILALLGYVQSMVAPMGAVMMGIGAPAVVFRLLAVQLILSAGLVYPCASLWGVPGIALSLVVGALLPNLILLRTVLKATLCPARAFGKAVWPPLAASVLMGAAFIALKTMFVHGRDLSSIAVLLSVGACCYLVGLRSLDGYLRCGIGGVCARAVGGLVGDASGQDPSQHPSNGDGAFESHSLP